MYATYATDMVVSNAITQEKDMNFNSSEWKEELVSDASQWVTVGDTEHALKTTISRIGPADNLALEGNLHLRAMEGSGSFDVFLYARSQKDALAQADSLYGLAEQLIQFAKSFEFAARGIETKETE